MSNNSSTIDLDDDHLKHLGHLLLFRVIVWGYAGMVLSLFGIVGNILTIFVLLSPSMRRTSTNIYLTALSCSNILYLLMFIVSYSMKYILGYRMHMIDGDVFTFEILLMRFPTTPIYNIIFISIIYLTIGVSIDRLIFVKFPLKARQILTQRRTLIAILSIYIFSIVCCIPLWLEKQYDSENNRCRLTSIGMIMYKYTQYTYIFIVYLIPVITLTCINMTTIRNLVSKKRRRKSLGARTQGDNYVILILVTATTLFYFCHLPSSILTTWFIINAHSSFYSLLFLLLSSVGVFLLVLNSSTNFLIHCFFGEKFREILIQFILRVIRNHNRQRNLQIRLPERQKQKNLQPSEQKQIRPLTNCSTTNGLNKSSDLNNTLNKNSSIYQPELSPLMTNSEEISVINEDVPF